jgi:nitrogen regulatory protein PII
LSACLSASLDCTSAGGVKAGLLLEAVVVDRVAGYGRTCHGEMYSGQKIQFLTRSGFFPGNHCHILFSEDQVPAIPASILYIFNVLDLFQVLVRQSLNALHQFL